MPGAESSSHAPLTEVLASSATRPKSPVPVTEMAAKMVSAKTEIATHAPTQRSSPSTPATPQSSRGLMLGSAIAVLVLVSGAAWWFGTQRGRETVTDPTAEVATTANAPVTPKSPEPVATVGTPPSIPEPTLDPLQQARVQAAAARDQRYGDVAKALELIFQKGAATPDDYAVRARAYRALADGKSAPAHCSREASSRSSPSPQP